MVGRGLQPGWDLRPPTLCVSSSHWGPTEHLGVRPGLPPPHLQHSQTALGAGRGAPAFRVHLVCVRPWGAVLPPHPTPQVPGVNLRPWFLGKEGSRRISVAHPSCAGQRARLPSPDCFLLPTLVTPGHSLENLTSHCSCPHLSIHCEAHSWSPPPTSGAHFLLVAHCPSWAGASCTVWASFAASQPGSQQPTQKPPEARHLLLLRVASGVWGPKTQWG